MFDNLQVRVTAGGAPAVCPAAPTPKLAVNEIEEFRSGRYVSAIEAAWRLFGFRMHDMNPSVERLDVHLPGGQILSFDAADLLTDVRRRPPPRTKLTEFFAMCNTNSEGGALARTLLYSAMPEKFVWDETKHWHIRQSGHPIGRIYAVAPNQGERYFLKLLLLNHVGPRSYEDLRTVDGLLCATFQEAAALRGFLQDDSEWDRCLTENVVDRNPTQLRGLFAVLLTNCGLNDPLALWNKHELSLCEDILYRETLAAGFPPGAEFVPLTEAMRHEGLREVDHILFAQGASLNDFGSMRSPPALAPPIPGLPRMVQEQIASPLNQSRHAAYAAAKMPLMNAEQRAVFDTAMACVAAASLSPPTLRAGAKSNAMFVYSPGGCGKTFTFELLLATLRAEGRIALAVASSGIAALLLEGGTTAHFRLKIPIELNERSTCPVSRQTDLGQLLRATSLLLWDEAPMTHKHAFEAVDRMLQNVMGNKLPFGGKAFVCSGDFRQVLPIVKRGNRAETVAAGLQRSKELWPLFTVMRLQTNMRAQVMVAAGRDATAQSQFAADLLRLGDGVDGEFWPVPAAMLASTKLPADLIATIYGDLKHDPHALNENRMIERCILTPLNEHVNEINTLATSMVAGPEFEVLSADSVGPDDNATAYQPEFLNSLEPNGLPPHRLILKQHIPVMALRNLSPALGIANGTRLVVSRVLPFSIQAKIVTGAGRGKVVLLPRITLSSSEGDLPFTIVRRQFPIRPAFAMTIHKAQGQTLKQVGVYLPHPVFSHGQLYVAVSRVGTPDGITIMVAHPPLTGAPEDGRTYTHNVVYTETFADL